MLTSSVRYMYVFFCFCFVCVCFVLSKRVEINRDNTNTHITSYISSFKMEVITYFIQPIWLFQIFYCETVPHYLTNQSIRYSLSKNEEKVQKTKKIVHTLLLI